MAKKEDVLVTVNNPSIHYGNGDYIQINEDHNEAWAAEVISNSSFVERWLAEQDASILQLIPYVVLFAPDLKVFSYQRRSGGETRLEGKYSVGVGGHVNLSDFKIKTVNKKGQLTISWDTVINGAVRELTEELELDAEYVRSNLRMVGTIYTPNSSDNEQSKPGPTVGQVHLGIVYTLPLATKAVVVREEDQMINYKFVNKPGDLQKYERWSQLVLQKIDDIREIVSK